MTETIEKHDNRRAFRADTSEVRLKEETQEYRWVTLDEALAMPVEYYAGIAIQGYLRRKGEKPPVR